MVLNRAHVTVTFTGPVHRMIALYHKFVSWRLLNRAGVIGSTLEVQDNGNPIVATDGDPSYAQDLGIALERGSVVWRGCPSCPWAKNRRSDPDAEG